MRIIASGERLILRDRLPSDVDSYFHWQTHGEWRESDVPWDGVYTVLTQGEEEEIRQAFLE